MDETGLCLHLHPGKSGLAPHMALLRTGAPFAIRIVDVPGGEQRSPEFLGINPFGTIPVLTDHGQIIPETGAILLHVAERFPDSALIPVSGPGRSRTQRWLFHAAALHADFMTWRRAVWALDGRPEARSEVQAWMARRLGNAFHAAESAAEDAYLAGQEVTAADLYWVMVAGWWTGRFAFADETPRLAACLQRTVDKDFVRRAYEAQGKTLPRFV